jgi:hypothetical protein
MIRHNFILLNYIRKWRANATKQNEITANITLLAECGSTYSNSQIWLLIQLSKKPILIRPTLWVLIQTKGQQHKLHNQYTWKEWKDCKSYTDNPKHLHSEWGLKTFTEVHQLWLPKSHWIWNGPTRHSTIPVNTSKCYFHTSTYETETLRHAQQILLLLGPKTYVWPTCQGLTHAVC